MAGLYIHVPFCKTKCHYCNFFSLASEKHKSQFGEVLMAEMELQKDYLAGEQLNTIYLGGGTPSLLSASDVNIILSGVHDHFSVDNQAEITIEANPDDITNKWIQEIGKTEINRFSLGVQSFFNEDLAYLNRVHDGPEAEGAIKRLQDAGFENMTIDLIYGIPTMDEKKWEENLRKFFGYGIPHLSAYALTVEEKTALHHRISKGKAAPLNDTEMVKQFNILLALTEEHDFIHYEISNFAKEGSYSRHNSLYWTGGHYLGIGPSAHSYNGLSRRWNKPSMRSWLNLTEYYNESFEEEILSIDQRFNEYVMTSLRTVWGCDPAVVRQEFGDQYAENLLIGSEKHIAEENLTLKQGRLFLTNKGKLFADGIASELFA